MTSSVNGSTTPEGREIGVSLGRVAAELRWWLLATVAASVAIATAAAFLMRPVYRAEALLLPVSQDGDMSALASMASQLGVLGSIAGLDIGGDGMRDRAIATLRSRAFMTSFIESKGLITRIFEDDWDARAARWTVDADDVPTLWEAQKTFEEDIVRIGQDRRTGLVTVVIEWRDPVEAARWANDMVAMLNRQIREQVIRESQKSLDYLNRELGRTEDVELRQAIFKLTENQARRIMLANVRDEYAFLVIDPASPPDADDFVRPQRAVLVAAGLVAGLGLALAIVLLVASLRRSARERS